MFPDLINRDKVPLNRLGRGIDYSLSDTVKCTIATYALDVGLAICAVGIA
jgi:hypothetical protein